MEMSALHMDNPVLQGFAFYASILIIKTTAMAFLTARMRVQKQVTYCRPNSHDDFLLVVEQKLLLFPADQNYLQNKTCSGRKYFPKSGMLNLSKIHAPCFPLFYSITFFLSASLEICYSHIGLRLYKVAMAGFGSGLAQKF